MQHILRLLNTNVDGKQKIMYALTQIKGVGRRYSNLVCKKADVDLTKRYVFILQSSITPIPHADVGSPENPEETRGSSATNAATS